MPIQSDYNWRILVYNSTTAHHGMNEDQISEYIHIHIDKNMMLVCSDKSVHIHSFQFHIIYLLRQSISKHKT